MNLLLDGLAFAKCYLDNVLVFGSGLNKHVWHLDEDLTQLELGIIQLHPAQCHFRAEPSSPNLPEGDEALPSICMHSEESASCCGFR